MHMTAAAVAEYKPLLHAMHSLLPVAAWCLPGGHASHAVAPPLADWYLPSGQPPQLRSALRVAAVVCFSPLAQSVTASHAVCPVFSWNVAPSAQCTQLVCPTLGCTCPRSQSSQPTAFCSAAECLPASHALHSDWPAEFWYVPGLQLSGATRLLALVYRPGGHAVHTRFASALPALLTYVPLAQSAHGWHTVSIELVPSSDAKEPLAQVRCGAHVSALVAVLNVPDAQPAHARFTVAEGVVDTAVPGPQSVHGAHTLARVDAAT